MRSSDTSVEIVAREGNAAPTVDFDALRNTITTADWGFTYADDPRVHRAGQSSVANALNAVATAAQLDPQQTAAFIDRIAARLDIGVDTPALLRDAYARGLRERAAHEAEAAAAEPPRSTSPQIAKLEDQLLCADWDYEFTDDPNAWKRGRASVTAALKAVLDSTIADPVGTAELVQHVSEKKGRTHPWVANMLHATVQNGIAIRTLPVYQPPTHEPLRLLEEVGAPTGRTITIRGRSEDGQRFIARDGGSALSISRDAFLEVPTVNAQVTVAFKNGRDVAEIAVDRSLSPER